MSYPLKILDGLSDSSKVLDLINGHMNYMTALSESKSVQNRRGFFPRVPFFIDIFLEN